MNTGFPSDVQEVLGRLVWWLPDPLGLGCVSPPALTFPTFGFHPQCFKMPAAAPAIVSTFQEAGRKNKVKQKGLSLVIFSPFQRTFPEVLPYVTLITVART